MEEDNSDSSNDSMFTDSVSSPSPVASTSASAASRAPTPTTSGILLPPSASAMNEVPLVPSPQQPTSSSKSKSGTSKELLKLTPLTPGELISKPKQKKCPRTSVPDAQKDEEYYEKRLKNTEAVRKWRERNEEQETRMKDRLAYLESEATRKKALIRKFEAEREMLLAQLQALQQTVKDMEEAYQKQMEAADKQNRKSPAP